MKHKMQSIGREKAIALADTGWWKDKSPRDIVQFQLFTEELSMPFGDFQLAVEKALGRPVFTHEFALNIDGIMDEFLEGKPAPSLEEIINLIPEDKRILILAP